MWFELFLGVIAVLLLVYHWWTGILAKYKSIAHLPGPVPLPILGNALLFANQREHFSTFLKLFDKYGPVLRVWLGCTPALLVRDAEMAELILRSPTYSNKGDIYRYLEPWLDNSMLTSTGDTWQRQNKMLSLSMNYKLMDNYLSVFNSSCDILVEILSARADGNTCNIAPLITSYTLDIIVESAMGSKLNCQRQPENEYARAVFIMDKIIIERTFSFWKQFDFLFMFSNDYKDQKEAYNILNDFAIRIIQKRRRKLLASKEDEEYMDDNGKKMTQPIDILLNTQLSEKEIRDDLSSVIYAGHQTTTAALQFLFYQLSTNQEVQNKIVAELKEIYGNDKNTPCTMEDTSKMKYMERVIKESMRYNAPVPLIARQLQEDVQYKNTILPKGLNIVFSLYGLHRNPDTYDDPDVFDPDRFIAEDSIKPYSFLPFSGGPRNCKGQKYALIELKVTVAKLLRNFEFLPAGPGSDLKLTPGMVLKTSNGINVRMKRRDF